MKNKRAVVNNRDKNDFKARPILKWAGGKQQLLRFLIDKSPKNFNKYIEPFLGGGALFYALNPSNAILSDTNPELIHLYKTVATDVYSLIDQLDKMEIDKDSYYQIRALDPKSLSGPARAARTLYLNKTCFNGLFRVNKKGQFNVPFGYNKNPKLYSYNELLTVSELLKRTTLLCQDYRVVLKNNVDENDFVYLDPPYLPISKYSDFKRYTKEQFYEEDHHELAAEVRRLHGMGCHVLLTNSNHPLVHELYEEFQIQVFQTRRNINCNGDNRKGQDVIITIPPKRKFLIRIAPPPMNEQINKYPSTRFMGSKQSIIPNIWEATSKFKFSSVIDLFSGSGIVSYMFKAMEKQVFSNDFMAMSHSFTKALIENKKETLDKKDIALLLNEPNSDDNFVANTFKGIYFSDEENALIDRLRGNIPYLKNSNKRSIATAALIRAALKKRPRGIFTYTGDRYDDGRKDLKLSFTEHFKQAVEAFNGAVFDNNCENFSRQGDAMTVKWHADLVYVDPPYYSPYSDNDYVRRYHFVEGLARNWQGLEIQEHTKTKKFKSYPSPFSSRTGAHDAFNKIFRKFQDSILLVSYSSNSFPEKDEMVSLMSKYKRKVDVISIDYRYSFANQGHKKSDNKNQVQEYLFVGY